MIRPNSLRLSTWSPMLLSHPSSGLFFSSTSLQSACRRKTAEMQSSTMLLRPPLPLRFTAGTKLFHSGNFAANQEKTVPLSLNNNCQLSSRIPISRLFLSRYSVMVEKKRAGSSITCAYSPQPSAPLFDSESDKAKVAQVAKRLESTARHFKRLGSFGFWGQLVATTVAAVILSFSAVVTGKVTSPATFYATAGGIAAAFISVFWSFGYIRLSERLRRSANDPSKAPPRSEVVKSLKNGILLNLLGMGAAVLGMQATVGLLVAKALTTSAVPYYQGISPGQSPVLALDVFLVQASANTILSHFLGLLFSLELLRSVTLPLTSSPPTPRPA